jgi:hypothetical protein
MKCQKLFIAGETPAGAAIPENSSSPKANGHAPHAAASALSPTPDTVELPSAASGEIHSAAVPSENSTVPMDASPAQTLENCSAQLEGAAQQGLPLDAAITSKNKSKRHPAVIARAPAEDAPALAKGAPETQEMPQPADDVLALADQVPDQMATLDASIAVEPTQPKKPAPPAKKPVKKQVAATAASNGITLEPMAAPRRPAPVAAPFAAPRSGASEFKSSGGKVLVVVGVLVVGFVVVALAGAAVGLAAILGAFSTSNSDKLADRDTTKRPAITASGAQEKKTTPAENSGPAVTPGNEVPATTKSSSGRSPIVVYKVLGSLWSCLPPVPPLDQEQTGPQKLASSQEPSGTQKSPSNPATTDLQPGKTPSGTNPKTAETPPDTPAPLPPSLELPAKKKPTPKVEQPKADPPKKVEVVKNTPPDPAPAVPPNMELPTIKKKKIIVKSDDKYRTTLSAANQKKVNDAIDQGVAYLRQTQNQDGSWGPIEKNFQFKVGYTALAGLVLLECGAKSDDPAVQKAARAVRFLSGNLNHTYQLSLAILFLDKLGEKNDQGTIRKLALRLIAGQNSEGGWTYNCPLLNSRENFELITFLQKTRMPHLRTALTKDGFSLSTPLAKEGGNRIETPAPKPSGNSGQAPIGPENINPKTKGGLALPFPQGNDPPKEEKPSEEKPKAKTKPQPPAQPPAMTTPFPIHLLSESIRKLAIVQRQQAQPQPFMKQPGGAKRPALRRAGGDNSNTQFAMIALWTARKYGIPMERTLDLIEQRFQTSQNPDGSWNYVYMTAGGTPQMTCVGLIGLAIGHGSHRETYMGLQGFMGKAERDPQIQNGLKHLGLSVGNPPMDWNQPTGQVNLYYLWSLERTAMLYNLKTVGGKDWYGWAAQMLVKNQNADGSWARGGYHGSSESLDTCLALLILRRANLVEDLTESLRLYIPIVDPDAAPDGEGRNQK